MEIVLLGHKYHQENLLAIARLRGHSLKSLVFAQRFITSGIESWYKAETTVVKNPLDGDSREVIMPLVLRDQK